MTRSDSSDSDRERRRSKKKRKERHRSRTRSSSSERYRKYKSHKSRDRSRSRSRERRRSRSRDQYKSRAHSRERSHKHRERSSSRDRDKKYRSKNYSEDELNTRSRSKLEIVKDKVDLKDKIRALTVGNSEKQITKEIVPSFEELQKFERESFVQESFSSVMINPSIQPKQKKKKKKKNQSLNQLVVTNNTTQNVPAHKVETISHENAIFGITLDTHVGKFSSRIDSKRKEVLKNVETDDLIFGAMFCESPEIRMKRWIDKLSIIRKRAREAGYG